MIKQVYTRNIRQRRNIKFNYIFNLPKKKKETKSNVILNSYILDAVSQSWEQDKDVYNHCPNSTYHCKSWPEQTKNRRQREQRQDLEQKGQKCHYLQVRLAPYKT